MPVSKEDNQLDAYHLENRFVGREIFFELVVDLMHAIHGYKDRNGVEYGCPCGCVSWIVFLFAKPTE